MQALIITVIAVVGVGALAWAKAKPRTAMGAALPPGLGAAAAALAWVIATSMGAGYLPGWGWAEWIAPLVCGIAVVLVLSFVVLPRRNAADTDRITEILKV